MALVDEKVKPLIENRGCSFRIRHFQQPTTSSSGGSIDDVIFGSHQMLSSMATVQTGKTSLHVLPTNKKPHTGVQNL